MEENTVSAPQMEFLDCSCHFVRRLRHMILSPFPKLSVVSGIVGRQDQPTKGVIQEVVGRSCSVHLLKNVRLHDFGARLWSVLEQLLAANRAQPSINATEVVKSSQQSEAQHGSSEFGCAAIFEKKATSKSTSGMKE
eukprot:5102536-Amphidinium_carterae.1